MQPVVILTSVLVALASCANIGVKKVPSFDGRIVGGFEIDIKIVPYQVSVRKNDKHICGGSIIAEDKILTAAHCTDGTSYTQLNIRVGSSIHFDGESFTLRAISQHPTYDRWSLSNDISVLYVSKPLTYGSNIQPIKLATNRRDPNTYLLVSGWGTLNDSSSNIPTNLQAVYVPIVSQDDCINSYPYDIVNNVMVCAGYADGGKDSCQGDSGGPLVDTLTGEQVGVVSWGYGCAKAGKPGVYASVPDLLNAIQLA